MIDVSEITYGLETFPALCESACSVCVSALCESVCPACVPALCESVALCVCAGPV